MKLFLWMKNYYKRKNVIMKKASRYFTLNVEKNVVIPIISLTEIDGNAWSLDGRFYVTEWTIEVNHAGVIRGVLDIHPLRSLQIDCSVLSVL